MTVKMLDNGDTFSVELVPCRQIDKDTLAGVWLDRAVPLNPKP